MVEEPSCRPADVVDDGFFHIDAAFEGDDVGVTYVGSFCQFFHFLGEGVDDGDGVQPAVEVGVHKVIVSRDNDGGDGFKSEGGVELHALVEEVDVESRSGGDVKLEGGEELG